MNKYEALVNLLPVIYPSFYVAKDKDTIELVFWDLGEHHILENTRIIDKTQFEAIENHFHLFEKVGVKNKESVVKIGISIAKNLLKSLIDVFPNKQFIVYLEVNVNDSTIIRFHQIWENEPLYFEVATFKNKDVDLFEFRSNR